MEDGVGEEGEVGEDEVLEEATTTSRVDSSSSSSSRLQTYVSRSLSSA